MFCSMQIDGKYHELPSLIAPRGKSENQFGFRQKKSCSLQLLKCKNEWTKLLDTGKTVDIIYIDFCKAFDSVSHQKLIGKLEAYGLERKLYLD